MEPHEIPLVRYVVFACVSEVKTIGEDVFVHFEGSRESIVLGPGYAKGDLVKITFEKQEPTDAQPK